MSYFTLSPIDDIPEDDLLLAWAEIWAFANGVFTISELQLDKEVLLEGLAALFPDEDAKLQAQEPGYAWERLLEELESKIVTAAELASEKLPFTYPFDVQPDAGVILSFRGGIGNNVCAACYLAMQLELLYRNKMASFWDAEGVNENSDQFLEQFRKVFEVVSALAVANFKKGVPVLVGSSRSVMKALIPALEEVCKIIGRGQPKSYDQLNAQQRKANDAGVDAIVILKGQRQIFECVMVSATTQQSSLRDKVMHVVRRDRVSDYLVDRTVLGPQSGVLAHSSPFDDGYYAICSEAGCVYLARETILENLYECKVVGKTERRSYFRSLGAASDPLSVLAGLRFQNEFSLIDLPCET